MYFFSFKISLDDRISLLDMYADTYVTNIFGKHYPIAILRVKLGSIDYSLASCQSEHLKKVCESCHLQHSLNLLDHGKHVSLPLPHIYLKDPPAFSAEFVRNTFPRLSFLPK